VGGRCVYAARCGFVPVLTLPNIYFEMVWNGGFLVGGAGGICFQGDYTD
jgi:hypothetical protein